MNSNNLKSIRTKSGLTQREFGKAIGVSGRTVESWEQGRRNVTELAKRSIMSEFRAYVLDVRQEEAAKFLAEIMAKPKAIEGA